MLGRRAGIGGEIRKLHDLAIGRRLQELACVRGGSVIAMYWPIRGEPDLRPLAAGWRAAGKTVALPVMGTADGSLLFCAWHDDSQLVMGPYGISIPRDLTPVAPDCLVIPCLGFNVSGGRPWRLGYGAGYYDRTLTARPIAAVGVAYDEADTDQFEPNAMDAPLSVLVTPSRVISSIASP